VGLAVGDDEGLWLGEALGLVVGAWKDIEVASNSGSNY